MPRKEEDNKLIQERSRKKILMAAFELFGKYGYAQTPVDHIAKKARVSKGLIYHYFSSKQDILKGLFALLVEEGKDLLAWSEELPPGEFLKRMIDFSIYYVVRHTKVNRMMIALSVQPDVIRGLKKDISKVKDRWLEILVRLFRELNYEDPEAEAYLFGAMMDGIAIGYITTGDDYPVEKLKKIIEKKYGV